MSRKYRRATPKNWLRYGLTCAHCGVSFMSSRPDAEYHAAKCREAASRARRAQLELNRRLQEALDVAHKKAEAAAKLKRKAKAKSRKRKTKSSLR